MIREQHSLINSAYTEGVVQFYNYVDFKDYLTAALRLPFFNYFEKLRPWFTNDFVKFVAVPMSGVKNKNITKIVLLAGGLPLALVKNLEFE